MRESSACWDTVSGALAGLGLEGPCQVHIAPTLLCLDDRAHQVFMGFDDWSSVARHLGRRHSLETQVWIEGEEGAEKVTLGCLTPDLRPGWVVLPALETEFGGGLQSLVEVVDRLLAPGGCPWDQAQTHDTLKRHLIEEAYELIEAIESCDSDRLIEELGDVLLQPVMHAQIAAKAGQWDIEAVARAVTLKLVRRHPHVFGSVEANDADEVLRNWDEIKRQEKGGGRNSALDGVPRSMPALSRAFEVSKRAARLGFEWHDLDGVWTKLAEEEKELWAAVEKGTGVPEELGDLLFTIVNIARWLKVDPEEALRRMVDRFQERFETMESLADRPLKDLNLDDWDELWTKAKAAQTRSQ
ncbi:MAG: nucleoside triphosphate pyrophosphohydrolase [Fimbriimonadaceae bacterium]|nr:nucleoside triphosphate pyrophosphohydrolase [Fimbriimonadaceae bacterium]QYK59406.1 MAG: nucleoside triphosphate pyrophosphohydrolase [Fimbriimonadaceae bacterium]